MRHRGGCRGGSTHLATPSRTRYNQNVCGVATVRSGSAGVAIVFLAMFLHYQNESFAQEDRPELRLRASPNLAFAGTEISFTGLLRGGVDDYEEFYCVSAEWDWDDGTRSESILDCDPYEPGSSEIRRRFSRRHSFDNGGRYEVRLNLKRGNDIVESARTNVTIRIGAANRQTANSPVREVLVGASIFSGIYAAVAFLFGGD